MGVIAYIKEYEAPARSSRPLPIPAGLRHLPHLHLWVHVSVDGRQPVDRLLRAGGALAIRENSFLVIIECL